MSTVAGPPKPYHPPDVRTYLHFREYLADYLTYRQSQVRGFSFQKWADELRIKSRSFLRMVLVGERALSEAMIPVFTQGLKLNEAQSRYFEALVRFNQAKLQSQREVLGAELMRLVKGSRRTVVHNHFAYLSSPLTPQLHTLLALDDLKRIPENLARVLGTTEKKIEELLGTLRHLNLAEPVLGGEEWRATSELFHLPSELGHSALLTFYRLNLEHAIEALDQPSDSRRYGTLLINLTPDQFIEVQKEVMGFFDQLLVKYGSQKAAGTKLYQLTESLIAVTPMLSEEKLAVQNGETK